MDRGAWQGYSPWGRKESDTTEWLTHIHMERKRVLRRLGFQEQWPELEVNMVIPGSAILTQRAQCIRTE